MSFVAPLRAISAGAEIAGQAAAPARIISGIVNEILDAAGAVHVNSNIAETLSRRANAMASILNDVDTDRLLGCSALQSFQCVLENAKETISAQGRRSYFSQLLHQHSDKATLTALVEHMNNSFDSVMVQLRIQADEMLADLVARSDMRAVTMFNALKKATPVRTAAIPPRPQLFFGRSTETAAVVDSVLYGSAGRVAILGGPGIGKTTLALSVLHYPGVVERFPVRLFIPCDAAESRDSSLAIIAEALGILDTSPGIQKLRLAEFVGAGPTLLVLDNFESAWEQPTQRADAEELLQFLSSMQNLSLILTMRGTERPQGIRWSRPFLPPLAPLSDAAAQQTFVSIADAADSDAAVSTLLVHMDNIPLAVVLLANLAQFEPPQVLLGRWIDAKTAMLSRGNGADRLSSLDVSIGLSLNSPRMNTIPAATQLLGVLALLPHGVVATDVRLWDLPQSSEALSVLQQTSLVTRNSEQRICVLAPIRQFVLAHYPPSDVALSKVYTHFFGLTKLTNLSNLSSCTSGVLADVAQELGNIEATISFALTRRGHACRDAVQAVLDLGGLYNETLLGPATKLLPLALSVAQESGWDALCADLLLRWGILAFNSTMPGDYQSLLRQALLIYQRMDNLAGVIECNLRLVAFLAPQDALVEVGRLLEMARENGDLRRTARCLVALANAHQRAGRPANAVAHHEQAIAILETAVGGKVDHELGMQKFRLGARYQKLGNFRTALQLYEGAAAAFEATQLLARTNHVYMQLAGIFIDQGKPRDAVHFAARVLESNAPATSLSERYSLLYLVVGHAMMGEIETAMSGVERIHRSRPEEGFSPYQMTRVLDVRAYVAYAAGDYESAGSLLSAARATARRRDPCEPPESSLELEGGIFEALGQVKLAQGHVNDAAVLACTAAIINRKMSNNVGLVKCLVLMAEVLDSDMAGALLGALLLPITWMGLAIDLGKLWLRSATLAQQRGLHDVARIRARRALHHFGEIKSDWRIPIAQRLAGYDVSNTGTA